MKKAASGKPTKAGKPLPVPVSHRPWPIHTRESSTFRTARLPLLSDRLLGAITSRTGSSCHIMMICPSLPVSTGSSERSTSPTGSVRLGRYVS